MTQWYFLWWWLCRSWDRASPASSGFGRWLQEPPIKGEKGETWKRRNQDWTSAIKWKDSVGNQNSSCQKAPRKCQKCGVPCRPQNDPSTGERGWVFIHLQKVTDRALLLQVLPLSTLEGRVLALEKVLSVIEMQIGLAGGQEAQPALTMSIALACPWGQTVTMHPYIKYMALTSSSVGNPVPGSTLDRDIHAVDL